MGLCSDYGCLRVGEAVCGVTGPRPGSFITFSIGCNWYMPGVGLMARVVGLGS